MNRFGFFRLTLGLVASILVLVQCTRQEKDIYLKSSSWQKLPGWEKEDFSKALSVFQNSCKALQKKPIWQSTCMAAIAHKSPRLFFEDQFQPYEMVSKKSPKGLATGYFIPILQGSFIASEFYRYPIYSTPPSLIHIDLHDFGLPSRLIRGRLEKQKVIPYWSRKEIDDNPQLLAGSELLWLADDIDAFVASIQGSALVRLSDDSLIRIFYADNNGHAYRSIGHYLLHQGYLPPGQASLVAIRNWLKQHPDQKKDILAQNPRYIFFKVSLDTTVKGAMGVPLTPGRSVAVDPRFIPLGTPLYTQMTATATHPAMKRLVFAQDVGSAIKGEKRLDVYWGEGEKAEYQASAMKSPIDHLWIILPKSWDRHTILQIIKDGQEN